MHQPTTGSPFSLRVQTDLNLMSIVGAKCLIIINPHANARNAKDHGPKLSSTPASGIFIPVSGGSGIGIPGKGKGSGLGGKGMPGKGSGLKGRILSKYMYNNNISESNSIRSIRSITVPLITTKTFLLKLILLQLAYYYAKFRKSLNIAK